MTPEELQQALAARASLTIDGVTFDRDGTSELRLNSLIAALEDMPGRTVTAWGRAWGINDLRQLRAEHLRLRGHFGG
jgi:hypothetical protein